MTEPLLVVEGLNVGFRSKAGVVQAVSDVSFELHAGEVLAVVGESGSGKSVTALTLMRLHAKSTRISGRAMFEGRDLLTLSDRDMRSVRGNDIAMIFQDPMTALNPVFSVGSQIIEAIRTHREVSKQAARARAIELLDLVGVPEPRRRVDQFPHEYSGGMRQRAMIAMAIANEPKVLIAHRPRRHRSGTGDGSTPRRAGSHRLGDAAHHPRPRTRGRHRRPRPSHVREPSRGDRRRR
jgi:ABC-type microcin C transport system duplicated ATPase subunit YejF